MNSVKPPCRLCLASTPEEYSSITDSAVRSKLDVIFKFELPLEDSLPHVVCPECSAKIDEFYSFHETVRANQEQLKAGPVDDVNLFLLVDVKGEPAEDDESDETDPVEPIAAAIDQNDDDVDDESNKSEPDEANPAQIKDVQDKKNKQMTDDNWKIDQFFNGIICSICSGKFITFGRLVTHCRKAHSQKASITCCDRKYFRKFLLIQHINSHMDPKHFYCELCKKNYGSKHYLEVHNMQVHANPDQHPYQCNICGKKFSRESLLTAHLKWHVQAKCSVCDKTMANIHTLKIHMQKMHSEKKRERVPIHICDTCGQAYHQRETLQRHINLQHLGITDRIQCPVCAKWVTNKRYLKIHMRNVHSGENLQVTCNICQQVYPNKRALSTHKSYVHAERNLECEVCGKMFKLQKNLREHRAAHMGQQLYTCTVCGYGSNFNGNLYTHMKNKHPVEYAEARARGGTLLATQSDPSVGV